MSPGRIFYGNRKPRYATLHTFLSLRYKGNEITLKENRKMHRILPRVQYTQGNPAKFYFEFYVNRIVTVVNDKTN